MVIRENMYSPSECTHSVRMCNNSKSLYDIRLSGSCRNFYRLGRGYCCCHSFLIVTSYYPWSRFQKALFFSRYQGSSEHGYYGADSFAHFGHSTLLFWVSCHLQHSCLNSIFIFAPYGFGPSIPLLGQYNTQPLERMPYSQP